MAEYVCSVAVLPPSPSPVSWPCSRLYRGRYQMSRCYHTRISRAASSRSYDVDASAAISVASDRPYWITIYLRLSLYKSHVVPVHPSRRPFSEKEKEKRKSKQEIIVIIDSEYPERLARTIRTAHGSSCLPTSNHTGRGITMQLPLRNPTIQGAICNRGSPTCHALPPGPEYGSYVSFSFVSLFPF